MAPIPKFSVDKHGNISMSAASLVSVVVLGLVGYQKFDALSANLATKDDVTGAIAVHGATQHPQTAEELAETSSKVNRLLEESLRAQIINYASRICADPTHPQVDTWRAELNRLLEAYATEVGRPFPPGLLECR